VQNTDDEDERDAAGTVEKRDHVGHTQVAGKCRRRKSKIRRDKKGAGAGRAEARLSVVFAAILLGGAGRSGSIQ